MRRRLFFISVCLLNLALIAFIAMPSINLDQEKEFYEYDDKYQVTLPWDISLSKKFKAECVSAEDSRIYYDILTSKASEIGYIEIKASETKVLNFSKKLSKKIFKQKFGTITFSSGAPFFCSVLNIPYNTKKHLISSLSEADVQRGVSYISKGSKNLENVNAKLYIYNVDNVPLSLYIIRNDNISGEKESYKVKDLAVADREIIEIGGSLDGDFTIMPASKGETAYSAFIFYKGKKKKSGIIHARKK